MSILDAFNARKLGPPLSIKESQGLRPRAAARELAREHGWAAFEQEDLEHLRSHVLHRPGGQIYEIVHSTVLTSDGRVIDTTSARNTVAAYCSRPPAGRAAVVLW